jgi:MFS family permease
LVSRAAPRADGSEAARKAALLSIATLTVSSTMVIAPSLPAMATAYAGTPNAELLVKLTLTMPAIAIALFAPMAGWVIDRYGRLPMLYASMVLFGLAGVSGYFIDDLYLMLASRLVLGTAIAGSMTTLNTLAGDYFTGEARGSFAGLQSMVMSFGAMLLVGVAGFIADYDWRYPFLLYAYSWLLIPVVAPLLTEPTRIQREANAAGNEPLPVKELVGAYVLGWFSAVMFYMVASQLPFLIRERGVESGLLLGLAVGLVQLFAAGGSIMHARLKRNRGFLSVYAIAFVLMATGYGLIWLTTSYTVVLLSAAIVGIGVGFFFPNSTLWVLMIAPPRMRGRCAGGLSASLNFGQFASPIVVQPIVAVVGLGGAFGVSAGTLLGVAVVLWVAPSMFSARSAKDG